MFWKKKEVFWEERFQALADYNSEIWRGVLHTKEYDKSMEKLQSEYNKKSEEWFNKHPN